MGRLTRATSTITILSVALLFACAAPASAKAPLKFTMSFDKKQYAGKDNINVTFELENTGKKDIYVNKRFFVNSEEASEGDREILLKVISPKGKELPCKVNVETGLPRAVHFELLKPGEKAKIDREKNIKYYYDFNEPGKYKITAAYKNTRGKELDLDVCKDSVKSAPVTIEILKKE